MQFIAVSVLLILVATASAMDPPALLWEREYFSDRSGWFNHVIQTSDGGYAVAASVGGYQTGNRPIIKLNHDGDIEWAPDNIYNSQHGVWVEQLPDTGYIATGIARIESGNSYGVFLLRIDSEGSTIWSKVYNLTSSNDAGICVAPLPDGGYAVCGEYDEWDALIMRTDANGDTLWTRVYDSGHLNKAYRIVHVNNGLTVFVEAYASYGPHLLRYSMDGELLWEQDYSGTFPGIDGEWGGDICLASNGGYMIASDYQSRIAQTDWEGNLFWDKLIPGSSERCGLSVNPTMDGGYIFSGWTGVFGPTNPHQGPEFPQTYSPPVDTGWTQDGWLVKLDSLGNADWYINHELGDRHNIFYSASQLQGGGYIVAGRRGSHAYLLRYAPETGIEEGSTLPGQVSLHQPSPNPFASSLSVSYSLPESMQVSLSVYDISGRLVGEIENTIMDGGLHTSEWDAGVLPSGCYMVRLVTEHGESVRNSVLVR